MKHLCLATIVAIGLTLQAFGQGVDPLVGTWKLNLEKSTYIGIPPVKARRPLGLGKDKLSRLPVEA
jgi:hypothetical protein